MLYSNPLYYEVRELPPVLEGLEDVVYFFIASKGRYRFSSSEYNTFCGWLILFEGVQRVVYYSLIKGYIHNGRYIEICQIYSGILPSYGVKDIRLYVNWDECLLDHFNVLSGAHYFYTRYGFVFCTYEGVERSYGREIEQRGIVWRDQIVWNLVGIYAAMSGEYRKDTTSGFSREDYIELLASFINESQFFRGKTLKVLKYFNMSVGTGGKKAFILDSVRKWVDLIGENCNYFEFDSKDMFIVKEMISYYSIELKEEGGLTIDGRVVKEIPSEIEDLISRTSKYNYYQDVSYNIRYLKRLASFEQLIKIKRDLEDDEGPIGGAKLLYFYFIGLVTDCLYKSLEESYANDPLFEGFMRDFLWASAFLEVNISRRSSEISFQRHLQSHSGRLTPSNTPNSVTWDTAVVIPSEDYREVKFFSFPQVYFKSNSLLFLKLLESLGMFPLNLRDIKDLPVKVGRLWDLLLEDNPISESNDEDEVEDDEELEFDWDDSEDDGDY